MCATVANTFLSKPSVQDLLCAMGMPINEKFAQLVNLPYPLFDSAPSTSKFRDMIGNGTL
jgi:hypothetical protein